MKKESIITLLPYKSPFLFVDDLQEVNENGIVGHYQYKENEYFYQGHFPDNPITPGVILTETMAQIGLVCLGIYLFAKSGNPVENLKPVFTSSSVEFLAPVYPNDKVEVISKKVYYRFNKLKCEVQLFNKTQNQLACRGELSGIIAA